MHAAEICTHDYLNNYRMTLDLLIYLWQVLNSGEVVFGHIVVHQSVSQSDQLQVGVR